ncbi:MAG: TauD/TfdA family dioxygenase [Rhodospirillaceae bacterium]|jgi:taurine dioxygenase|nr:TauD/TfdA family dioxygenase [Rhodospirillaceae bacterium]MBT3886203.1 TauD/TfdA family dioxygenase [Rhodospirillaceae bacterium]MBT4671693.1 TauD/TfdA family dioxygenase [Rhodospirillaceae bacterium]MBT5178064.1 TauD/TfdA family dioxygenase [Rhodospirillaceae bacterium]MBT6291531.1 TauD/TfdA family dioxygenase [Rhodospirillaceae bacterium]
MSVQVTPLSDAIGAEITGVDLNETMDGEVLDTVHAAWLRFKIILFRGTTLSADDQTRFAQNFGDIQPIRSATHILGDNQQFMHVSNRDVDGKPGVLPEGEMQFHNDQSYYERPAKATILNAIEIPDAGGHTLFMNTVSAYAALSADMKARLDGLRVLNIYDYDTNPTIKGDGIRADAPQFEHPVVIHHPETREQALFVSRLMSDHITGMERADSDALLTELFDHMEQPQFIFEHSWRPGDLLMWDNFASQHARTDFDPAQPRILRRVAVAGSRPEAAP